jgi:hypothetical protein
MKKCSTCFAIRDANQNYTKISFHPVRKAIFKATITNVGEDVAK